MKIHIVGESGSGKTRLAMALAQAIGAPHLELDRVWVRHGGKQLWSDAAKRSNPDRLEKLARAIQADVSNFLKQESWVIDGNYSIVRNQVYVEADTIIYLEVTYSRRLWRILKRQLFDREWSLRHFPFFFWKFLNSARRPPRPLLEAQTSYPWKLVVLKTRDQAEEFVDQIRKRDA